MSAVALKLADETDAFRQDFAAHARELPGAGIGWLDARRAGAMEAFAKTGIPNRRVEAWKYTDLANAFDFVSAPAPRVAHLIAGNNGFSDAGAAEIVLANGYLQSVPSLKGVDIVDLGALAVNAPDWAAERLGLLAAGPDQPLGAASLALMRGGVAIRVQANTTWALHLRFVNIERIPDSVVHARALIVLEHGASLRLVESHVGTDARTLNNIGIEIAIGANAALDHLRLQAEGANALHVTSLGVQAACDAAYRAVFAASGAALSRVDAKIALAEPGAEIDIRNVAVISAGIADTTTVVEHAAPHTTSRQLFKSVVGGRGRAVNQGRVTVAAGAVKSDSHQLFKALLLSDRAEADARPELEIFADDVLCGHGTAIGAPDEAALFYLRARGIPEHEARHLLVRAFLADAIEDRLETPKREALWRALDGALSRMGAP